MKICVKCPCCKNQLLLSSKAADRRITCPMCLNLFKVPALNEISDAVKALNETNGNVFIDGNGNYFG